jgi:putative Holliday junction resolvase
MALDVGSKRCGVAVTDPLKLTSRPLLTFERESLERDVEMLTGLMRKYQVERLIVGQPRHLSGRSSPIEQAAIPLVSRLRRQGTVPVEWMDERLSTKEAESVMRELGIPEHLRRQKKDEFAAAVILKWYLEERGSPGFPG